MDRISLLGGKVEFEVGRILYAEKCPGHRPRWAQLEQRRLAWLEQVNIEDGEE